MVAATAFALTVPAATPAAAAATHGSTSGWSGGWTGDAASDPASDPAPAPAQAADLSVAILGGATPAGEHSAIDYTIELRNSGRAEYRKLAVTAMLPPGFRLVHASPASSGHATWTVDLAPGQRMDIQARIAAGSVQDLADGPLENQAWYTITACVRSTCGLSSQLLLKGENDTRQGIESIILLLGLPAAAAALGAYAWRARHDPEIDP